MTAVKCGIDNEEQLHSIIGDNLRVGLITNHTGLDRSGRPTAVALRESGVDVVRMFAPEHGLAGEIEDQDAVEDAVDPVTGLPVLSLYGVTDRPAAGVLDDLDALVFDIQDIGSRYYTFNWTMVKCMEAAAGAGVRFVVLDRPNPITGTRVEGNVSRRSFSSLVGLYPCAARHGMTSGEIARYVNGEFEIGADLSVVKMSGWRRDMWFDETGLIFVPPSPNTTGIDMAALYPGTCLFEGTNLSEGRGTTRPFEVVGAPWMDPLAFAEELNERELPGVWFRPTYFIPYTSKHARRRCGGVQVHIRRRGVLCSFEVGLHMLCTARSMSPEFEWKNDPHGYAIDLLAGTDELRREIDRGAAPEALMDKWSAQLSRFEDRSSQYLLY